MPICQSLNRQRPVRMRLVVFVFGWVFSSLFFVVSRYMLHVWFGVSGHCGGDCCYMMSLFLLQLWLWVSLPNVIDLAPCCNCNRNFRLCDWATSETQCPWILRAWFWVSSRLEKLLLIFHSFVFLCGMSWGWNMSQQIETINQLCCDAWMHDFDKFCTCGNVPCLAPAFVLECSRSTGLHQTTCEDFTICNHGSHPSCMSMCKVERTGKIIAAICCHSFLGWFSL